MATDASEKGGARTAERVEHDSFEDFDRAQGAGIVHDPYPRFAAAQRRCPVHEGGPWDVLEIERPEVTQVTPEAPQIYTAMTHDAVSRVLRDARTFSSRSYEPTMGIVMGHTILEMDEPEHGRYRAVIQKAFTRKALERWEAGLVRPIVDAHLDRFAGRGRANLVRELTFPFPVAVIAGMLGLPREDLPDFHRWAVELLGIGFDFERGMAAAKSLHECFAALIPRRRREPREDLISLLARAELDGTRLEDEEIVAFVRLLLPAGAETTYRSSSNLLLGLLTHPDQLEAVRRDRSLIPQATEEGLRWEPPITAVPRVATRDAEIGGVKIPAGAWVFANLGAANNDASRHGAARDFDIFREPRQHLAFGFGPHRCLGMHLARMETKVALEAVLDRLTNLRLDPDAPAPRVTGMALRSPPALPVRFDPR